MSNIETLTAALRAAIPVLEEHAEDERAFWGSDDKHGLAAEAEKILNDAQTALSENAKSIGGAR